MFAFMLIYDGSGFNALWMGVLMIIFCLQYFSLSTHVTAHCSSKRDSKVMGVFSQQLGYILTETTGIRRYRSIKLYPTTVVLTSARQVTGAKNSVHSFTIITMPCSIVFNWVNLELMKCSVLGFKCLFVWRRKVGRFLFLFAFLYFLPSKACVWIKMWNLI